MPENSLPRSASSWIFIMHSTIRSGWISRLFSVLLLHSFRKRMCKTPNKFHNRMNRISTLIIALFLFLPFFCGKAQGGLESLSPNDYLNLKLPPLDVLFENAKNSAAVDFYQVKMEEEASALKTEKRSWLKYFRFNTTYQWGLMGINSAYSDSDTPLFYQYSGGRQNWYNVGVSLSVPFDDFFDRGNRIHRQQLK